MLNVLKKHKLIAQGKLSNHKMERLIEYVNF